MKKLRTLVLSLAIMFSFSPLVLMPAVTHAQAAQQICEGVGLGGGGGGGTGCDQTGARSVDDIIKLALNIVSVLIGVVAVFMIMFGGFRYVTSAGDSGKLSSAKDTILYAIIGLVVVALAQIIVKFVLTKVK